MTEPADAVDQLREDWKLDEAEELGRRAVTEQPGDPARWIALGRVQLEQYRRKEALESFSRAAGSGLGVAWQVAALSRLRRYDEADGAAAGGLERFPGSADLLLARARIRFDQDDWAAGLPFLEEALASEPGHLDAARWRVMALATLGRFDDAEAAGQLMIDRHPDHPDPLTTMAWAEDERERYDEALGWAERALAVDPRNEWALRSRVRELWCLERYDDAMAAGLAAIELLPRGPRLLRELGWVENVREHYEESLGWFEKAREIAPRDGRLLRDQSMALALLDRFAEAEAVLAEAREIRPDDPVILVQCGLIAEAQAHYEDAVGWFEHALAVDPRDVDALRWRLRTLRSLKRYPEAEAAAREAVERRPRDVECLVLAGEVYEDQFNFEAALSWAERALALDPKSYDGLVNRTFALRRLRRFEESAATAREAAALHPEEPIFRVHAGWAAADLRQHQQAIEWYDRALELDPAFRPALQAKIFALRVLRRFDEADTVVNHAIDLLPGDASLLVYRGWNHDDRGERDKALDSFRQATDLDPAEPWAWQSRIALLVSMRRFDEAEAVFEEAVRHCPDEPNLPMERVALELARYRYAEALVWCDRALELDPVHAEALEKRVRVLRRLRRFEEAEAAAHEAVGRRPDEPDLLVEQASLYESQWRLEEALVCLGRALEIDPVHEWALRSQSSVYSRMRRFDEAKACTQTVLRRQPDHLLALVQMALLSRSQSGAEKSLEWFDRVLAIDPRDATALECRATAFRELRRFDEARAAVNEAIELLPNDPDLRLERALLLQEGDRLEESLANVRQALEIDPLNSDALEGQAVLLRQLSRFDEAEAAAKEAIELRPDSPDLPTELGVLYDDQLRYEESLVWFDRALRTDPCYLDAISGRSAALRALRRFDEAERGVLAALRRMPWNRSLREELVWIYHDSRRLDEAGQQIALLQADSHNAREEAETAAQAGWIRFAAGDYPAAEGQFRTACEKDPGTADHQFGLAWCLVRQATEQSRREAEQLCFSVLEKKPRHHSAHTCLGVINYQRGNYAQAEQHFRRAIELDRHHASYVDLASLYSQLGRFDEAEENLTAALKRDWYDAQAHVELGYLHLQRGMDDPDGKTGAVAARHFRQARQIDPANGSASLGLAVALMRSTGDFVEGEAVLQQALQRRDCDLPRWQLLVAVAKLLIERGDATQGRQFHSDALAHAQEAISLAAHEAEPYFVAAVARYKLAESAGDFPAKPMQRRKAIRDLRRCVKIDPGNVEARRSLQIMEESLRITRSSTVGSVVVVVVGVAALSALWTAFFLSDKVTGVMLTTLTPVLVGLMVVGLLLPFLIRLKLPGGVEADLSASIRQISSGPTGEETFGPGRFSVTAAASPGPKGQLARL
ncbi:tetratricopeptide repeat protein [Amycolatopsis benzoatilytica]|uniref:tetratricopeptide repeat protein n=1 Tax=Amycolatopsis benzoatilytica TaxID=346045 RepID=UPI0003798CB5|nr:tetratricopeptide repeat protein [Amycolatopsis benzoatilytica]